MSGKSHKTDAAKKHRHDVGAPDHGPATTESTTRAIQVVLGLCIAATGALLVYALGNGLL